MTFDLLNRLDEILRNYMLIGALAYVILPLARQILQLVFALGYASAVGALHSLRGGGQK